MRSCTSPWTRRSDPPRASDLHHRRLAHNAPVQVRSVLNRTRAILAAYAMSGAAGLIYEVVWQRSLALIIGSTTVATAATLVAFLGGLAVGAFAVGAIIRGTRHPLKTYAFLELGIAGCAAALTWLWADTGWWAALTWRLAGESSTGLLAARWAVAGASLLLPAALMGGTFPVLAAYRPDSVLAGAWVPMLYAANTLGGVVGAAGAGFLFLPALGARGATAVAILLNACAAVAALAVSRRRAAEGTPGTDVAVLADPAPRRAVRQSVTGLWLVIGLGGAVTLAFEVVWTRALTLVLGSSTYAFATMLVTYIGGLALGAVVGAQVAPRLQRPAASLGWVQIGTAVGALLALHLVPQLPVAFLYMFRLTGDHPLALTLGMSALSAAIMLPTALTQGMIVPIAIHVLAAASRSAGRGAGAAYAVSTVGAVAGTVVTTFWLIPALRIEGAGGTVAAAALVGAALAFASERQGQRWPAVRAVVTGAFALALVFPRWDPVRLGTGVYRDAPQLLQLYPSPREFPRIFEHYRPLFYRDGAGASVLVYERPSLGPLPHRVLTIDGKVEASTAADMATQVLSGHVPLFVGAPSGRALVVGVASGITLGALARHPFREIVAVEIEPAVLEAASAFRAFNHDVLNDPRVRLVVDDGRNYLAAPGRPFDVIVSEPSNPWIPGAARLFTHEFFRLARQRLSDDGVFVQWIQLYGLEPELLRAVVRTFQAVFPEALAVRSGGGDLLLLGAARPVRLDYARTAELLRNPAVSTDLERVGIREPAEVAAALVVGGAGLRAYAGTGLLNTDDNALVEFGAFRSLYRDTAGANLQALLDRAPAVPMEYLDRLGATAEARAAAARDIARAYLQARQEVAAYHVAEWSAMEHPSGAAWWLAGEAANRLGDVDEARRAWLRALVLEPRDTDARLGLLRLAWRTGDLIEVSRQLESLAETGAVPSEAWHVGGLHAARQNAHALAIERFRRALAGWTDARDRWVVRYALAASLRALDDEPAAAAETRYMSDELKAWCALLEEAPPAADQRLTDVETEAMLDGLVADKEGVTRLMAQRVFEPLSHFYRGKTLYLLGYASEAARELERAVELGGCAAARRLLALVRGSSSDRHLMGRPRDSQWPLDVRPTRAAP